MNERIRELAVQAGAVVYEWSDSMGMLDFDVDRFAELIIQDCADLRLDAEHYKSYARSLYLAAQPFCNIKADDGDTFNGYAPETIIRFEATVNEFRRLRICAGAGLPADGVAIDAAMKECGK